MGGVVVPDESHLDSEGLSVTAEVFGRSWTTGLKKRIRSEEGMSYEIGCFYSGDRGLGHFRVNGKVHTKRQERAIDIIFEELEKMKQTTFDEDEVLRAKRRVAYKVANGLENSFSGFMNVDPINIGAIAKIDYALKKKLPIKEQLLRIEQITPATIQRVANEYLPSSRENDNYVLLVRDPLKK